VPVELLAAAGGVEGELPAPVEVHPVGPEEVGARVLGERDRVGGAGGRLRA
jgi:hypothetical protein